MNEAEYRPGLENVIAGETAISTIAGGLQYRGYRIEDLADHATFEETAYLVLYGELPNQNELDAFSGRLQANASVPPQVIEVLGSIPPTASMMDVMRSATSLLAHWDAETEDSSHDANLRKSERLLAQLPVVLAARYRLRQGKQPVAADPSRTLASNLLWMLHDEPPSARQIRALDLTLILYAEHEFNASTFTARVVCSTLSDLHASVAASIGALKGPLHGGANERVMDILLAVESAEAASEWVQQAFANKTRIMGFGHRVYKEGDPRARYLKSWCEQLAEETNHQDFERNAQIIEDAVVSQKGIPPNLDWPSARLYYYLGLPIDLYTPLFVVSRVVGWSAHVVEQLDNNRLIRPRANYTGELDRDWLPMEGR